jgi:hypothetical protein
MHQQGEIEISMKKAENNSPVKSTDARDHLKN